MFWFPSGDPTLSELDLGEVNLYYPGLPKRNPGLELANAFSVILSHFEFSQKSLLLEILYLLTHVDAH